MTVAEALKKGSKEVGQRNTNLLLNHITGKNILLYPNENIDGKLFNELLNRCKTGEPLQYIIGNWDFMGFCFKTDKRALIPRPETELLVEDAFEFLKARYGKPVKILDLCTGTGCIAISLAYLCLEAKIEADITAADISPEALELAKINDSLSKISFIQSDLFTNIHETKFDLIISNPPYIPTAEIFTLQPTVKDYEPHLALDGGQDGMDIYRKIIPQSLNYLKDGGALYLELGPADVAGILDESNFKNITIKNDYAGLPRVLYGVKHDRAMA